MSSVFISGSIAIKSLPVFIEGSLQKITEQNIQIIVGDAEGIDSKIQEYCQTMKYFNVVVYSIYRTPRKRISNKFKTKYISIEENIKSERLRQQEKDKAMTMDSDYSFVIWDCKSKGSYSNIIRAIENNKKIKVFLEAKNTFMQNTDITKNNIEFLYRKTNGYKAGEIVDYLINEGECYFKNTQSFHKWLIENKVIKKEEKIYMPVNKYEHLFMIEKYRGRATGIKFRDKFIDWIKEKIKEVKPPEQSTIF